MTEKKKVRYNPKTAADVLAPHADKSAAGDAELAEEAGAIAASYADYAEALDNYQGRSDVETLANRRAREVGASFSENDHHREHAGHEEKDAPVKSTTAVPPVQAKGQK